MFVLPSRHCFGHSQIFITSNPGRREIIRTTFFDDEVKEATPHMLKKKNENNFSTDQTLIASHYDIAIFLDDVRANDIPPVQTAADRTPLVTCTEYNHLHSFYIAMIKRRFHSDGFSK